MLREVLVDGRARVNVMTIPIMKYLRLRINRLTLITLKMANKQVVRSERVINNVVIIIMKVSTIVDFYVVLKEDGAYPMILGKPWLKKSHVKNYRGERYMTIGVHLNQ